jgi:hypothetical protein
MTTAWPPELVPRYLTAADYPWLRLLIDEHDRYVGRRRAELDERLRQPLGMPCDSGKLRAAMRVLERQWCATAECAVPPRRLRAALFRASAREASREAALAVVARELGLPVGEIHETLFADLPTERRVRAPAETPAVVEVALRANLAIVRRLLERTAWLRITVRGEARALVRQAKQRGLLCQVCGRADSDGADLEISGPLAIFHRTTLYGRALGSLVPRLAWCRSFKLRALCHTGGPCDDEPKLLLVQTGDPIFPANEPRHFDSRLEERFARDFGRAAPEWELVREPEPIDAQGALLFPDFELRHRHHPDRRWLLEIAGFWTPEYLARKLELLGRARLDRFILCIDDERACGDSELPPGAAIVRYRRRVDPARVLAIVERGSRVDCMIRSAATGQISERDCGTPVIAREGDGKRLLRGVCREPAIGRLSPRGRGR